MRHLILLFGLLAFCITIGMSQGVVSKSCSSNTVEGPDPNFHIYICFGQSNMEGPAPILEQDTTGVDPRFQVMTVFSEDLSHLGRKVGNWYTAKPPLCKWYTGLGPYDYFGRTLTDSLPDSIKVGVIVVAMGGSGIDAFDKVNYAKYYQDADAWQKGLMNSYGGSPYKKIIEMAKKAQQSGVIKGILLHQGESNNGQWDWLLKVKKIYDDMISDLSLTPENVTLLSGEMLSQAAGGICWGHNNIMANLPYYVPNSYIISSAGCSGVDEFHFTNEGMHELGKRYGLQMLSILKTYNTEEGQTVDHLSIEKTDFTLLTGTAERIPLSAVFADGHTLDIRFRATYEISNPEAVRITNGYIEPLKDGSAVITASYKGALGEQKQVVFNVTATTFPLTNALFNPDIWGDGTFNETTSTLKTGQWGFGGWQYGGIDLSGYKYIVAKLGSANTADINFNIYDGNSYWGSPASYKFGSSKQIVAILDQAKKNDGLMLNTDHIYIAGFWSNGNSPFVIDTVFLSNSSEYDPPAVYARDIQGVETKELKGFRYELGSGPSTCQTIVISGDILTTSIIVTAPTGFEVSKDSTQSFSSKVTLVQSNGKVAGTNVYVRMKFGLTKSPNTGNITLASTGAFTKTVALTGTVGPITDIEKHRNLGATIVSTQYYSITGQRLNSVEGMNGIFIVKKLMSDGAIQISKIKNTIK